MKYFSVIVVALLIDAFQALIALALAGVGFAAGASVAWIPLVGQATAAGVSLGGVLLGIVIDFCISAVFGSGLIFLMILTGITTLNHLFSMRRMPFIAAKFIPFINALPLYTAMVVASIVKKIEEEKLEGLTVETSSFAMAGARPMAAMARAAGMLSPDIAQAALPGRPIQTPQEETAAGRNSAAQPRQMPGDIRPKTPLARPQSNIVASTPATGGGESGVKLRQPQPSYGLSA